MSNCFTQNRYKFLHIFIQGILAAVLSGVLGAKDPEQVNTMAKQAGEVIFIFFFCNCTQYFDINNGVNVVKVEWWMIVEIVKFKKHSKIFFCIYGINNSYKK